MRRGLLSQSSQEAAGAAFPSPEGTTPAQASGHTNSFFFFQQRGIMEWFGISEPIPSPEQGHLPHPALDTCRGLAAPAALGKDTIPAPLSLLLPQFPRWERLLLLSHSSGFPGKTKLLQLCPVSKTSPHFFRKTHNLLKAAAAIIPFNCTRGWESINSYCK